MRDGDLEAAVAAYAAGWQEGADGDTAGVLAYNLGTTLHRLGRRAEALLWYRRAEPLRPGDRWLAENLALVRAELAAARQPPPGPAAWLVSRRGALATVAVAAAWAALALLVVGRLLARRGGERCGAARVADAGAAALAFVALLCWAAPAAASLAAPRPAVLIASCGGQEEAVTATGERGEAAAAAEPLPIGSEVWVRRTGDGGWTIAGEPDGRCPAEAFDTL